MAFRHPTDPFGDGSLLSSWTFKDALGALTEFSQDNTDFWDALDVGVSDVPTNIPMPPFGYNFMHSGSDAKTDVGMLLNGNVNASFISRIYVGTTAGETHITNLAFGDFSVANNVEINSTIYGTYNRISVFLDKRAYEVRIENVGVGWHTVGISKTDSAGLDLVSIYLDGIFHSTLDTSGNPISFNDFQPITFDAINNGAVTDIAYLNRVLTEAEHLMWHEDDFHTTPIHRGLDPMLDGNMSNSWSFDNLLRNDQDTITLPVSVTYNNEFDTPFYEQSATFPNATNFQLLSDHFLNPTGWTIHLATQFASTRNSGIFDLQLPNFTITCKGNGGSFIFEVSDTGGLVVSIGTGVSAPMSITVSHNGTNLIIALDGSIVYNQARTNYLTAGAMLYSLTDPIKIDELLLFDVGYSANDVLYINEGFVSSATHITILADSDLLTLTALDSFFPTDIIVDVDSTLLPILANIYPHIINYPASLLIQTDVGVPFISTIGVIGLTLTVNEPLFDIRDDALLSWIFTDGNGDGTLDSIPSGNPFTAGTYDLIDRINNHNSFWADSSYCVADTPTDGLDFYSYNIWIIPTTNSGRLITICYTDTLQHSCSLNADSFFIRLAIGNGNDGHLTSTLMLPSDDGYYAWHHVSINIDYNANETHIFFDGVYHSMIPRVPARTATTFTRLNYQIKTAELLTYSSMATQAQLDEILVYFLVKVLAPSLLLSLINPLKYGGVHPNPIDLVVQYLQDNSVNTPDPVGLYFDYMSQVLVSSFPIVSMSNQININFNQPTVQGLKSFAVLVNAIDLVISINLTGIVAPSLIAFLSVITPNYVGYINTNLGGVSGDVSVFAQSIKISLVVHYLPHPNNAYIQTQSLMMKLTRLDNVLWETVFPETLDLKIDINPSVAQPINDKRVMSIGSVNFDRGLYWSANLHNQEFIATTATTVDGNTIYSVTPLKKFSKKFLVSSKSGIIVSKEKLDELIAITNVSIHKIVFSDGSFEFIKFDLINNPLIMSQVFEGSDKYYIDVGVWV